MRLFAVFICTVYTAAAHDETESGDAQGLRGSTHQSKVAVEVEQIQIGIDIVVSGYRIEDEVETAAVLFHFVGIAGNDHFVRAIRAPGSNVTLTPPTRAGAGGLKSGSTRTVPLKYSAGPLPEGCDPLRLISIVLDLHYSCLNFSG